jgi:homoserine kinase type II
MDSQITETTLSAVLAQYPLRSPRVVERMEASVRNDNFLVEDAPGRRYVLRHYRRNPDERRMRFQLTFQQQLYGLGYPTSEIIPSNVGELFVEAEGRAWVLFTFVEGDEYDFSNMAPVAEAGRRLAQFHTLTIAIELDEPRLDINFDARRWWTRGEQELGALEEMFGARGIEEEIAFLRPWHAGLLRHWPLDRLDALPKGWVHSDFHGRNMVFVGAELRGLFDFDPLHRGFWAEDLGHALFMFAREFRGSMRIRPDAARLFLDAYAAIRPLSEAERAAISMMAVLAWVPSAPYQELLRRDGEDALASFRHDVALMRALELEIERLTPLLAKTS